VAPFDAFIELYEREGEAVLRFLARRTLDVDVAVDLTAETFAQAWRGWSRLRVGTPEELRGWLFVIARRQLARYLRRGRVERRALERFGLQSPLVHEDDRGEIEQAAGLGELRRALGGELAKLSAEQREALQLRVVDELSYAEVALRLGVSEPAARARVSRGLRALAFALEPLMLNEGSAR
jgi:RNA polymerase sigma-70 factor (ECF subfamily)